MLYRREGFPGEDELVLCTVTKIVGHAVFVNLDEYDKGGLVHISEIAPGRIRNIREYVEVAKKIVCKVLRIDSQRGHIDLSLRRVSQMERKRKLEDIKQEQKAEKVIEQVSKEVGKKVEVVYDALTEKVFAQYPFVYLFFQDIAEGNVKAATFVDDKKLADLLQEKAEERFTPARVQIRGVFTLRSFASDGVDVVRNVLLDAEKKVKDAGVIITYLGGGKYKLVLEADTYKEGEKVLDVVRDFVLDKFSEDDASFVREEV